MKAKTAYILIGTLGLLCVALGILLGINMGKNNTKSKEIEAREDSIIVLQTQRTQMEEDIASLTEEINNQYGKLQYMTREVKRLKKKVDEKVDSVGRLNDHDTFLYTTKYLTSRDTTERR